MGRLRVKVAQSIITTGATGEQGATGLSAYQVAQANGFTGTAVEWLNSLVGPTGAAGATTTAGVATLDFGTGSVSAETIVTGYPEITTDSVVIASMRIAATAEHPTDDLLVDPIRLAVKDLVAGVGFTIYGEMDNAEANGAYEINWIIN